MWVRSARVGRNSPTPKPYEIDTGDLGPPLTDSPRDTFTIQPEFTGHVCSPKVLEASSHIGGFVPTVASCSVSCRIFVQASGPSLITFLSRGGKISQNGARITQHRGRITRKPVPAGEPQKSVSPYHYRITTVSLGPKNVSLAYHCRITGQTGARITNHRVEGGGFSQFRVSPSVVGRLVFLAHTHTKFSGQLYVPRSTSWLCVPIPTRPVAACGQPRVAQPGRAWSIRTPTCQFYNHSSSLPAWPSLLRFAMSVALCFALAHHNVDTVSPTFRSN